MNLNQIDPMTYLPGMEVISSDVMERVCGAAAAYDPASYTARDVERALSLPRIDTEAYGALLSPAAQPYLEQMARRAQAETRAHFGNSVCLFTPLYIANYCENYCVYCGFNCHNHIRRAKLTMEEIEEELRAIAGTGLQEILLLTGESRGASGVEYIGEAVRLAARYFRNVGVEIYPLNSDEYRFLHQCGADFVSVYQETYDPELYAEKHLSGHKRVYPYRFYAQERALLGGMRGVAFGALLGLGDFRRDAFAAGLHAYYTQQKYPQAEISFSCPRLRPYIHNADNNPNDVHETQLLQVILSYRLFLPYAGITISTRERAGFRDHAVELCATKISAGVHVGVGGHEAPQKGDEQFEISDPRSVEQVDAMLRARGLQPVYIDYLRV